MGDWKSMFNRRDFLRSGAAFTLAARAGMQGQTTRHEHTLPPKALANDPPGVVETPVPEYRWASDSSYEAFRDMKFGVRLHWGIYSIWHRGRESWPFLTMSYEDRQSYMNLYRTWNPAGFDAAEWMDLFAESGMKMFAFTTKHHEGFCMFDTKTRVKQRANWTTPGGPRMEACDLPYSIMQTPFRRDVVKELCAAARKKGIKIDLYFSHTDWYDADFRPYGSHPLQVPSSVALAGQKSASRAAETLGKELVIVPDPSPAEVTRMMERHRAQLTELLSNYGEIDMMCLDINLGPSVWPEMRKTILHARSLQPNVMFRNRGIGAYGDYYTPERYVPGDAPGTDAPWFVIYPLGTDFSYEQDAAKHKGTEWIIHTLVDAVAKGGNFMVGVGPDANGRFHPEAARQLRETGAWLKINGEAIYATRAREGSLWSEGEKVRYTRSKDGRAVYAIVLAWPGPMLSLSHVKPRAGSEIRMLGVSDLLTWIDDKEKGLAIKLPDAWQNPERRPCPYAWCFKIEMDAA